MTVRELSPDDWELRRGLRLAALSDSPEAFLATYDEAAARTEHDWRHWPASGAVFAAFVDGEPAGLVGVFPRTDGLGAGIFAMWVAPPARGTGAAAELIQASTDWAAAQGFGELHLEVAAGNARAERFYRRLGFVESGETPIVGCDLTLKRPIR